MRQLQERACDCLVARTRDPTAQRVGGGTRVGWIAFAAVFGFNLSTLVHFRVQTKVQSTKCFGFKNLKKHARVQK